MTAYLSSIAQKAKERKDYLIKVRRALHRCPELGFELPMTAEYIEKQLDDIGIAHSRQFGECSITAIIGPEKNVPVIAVRADMDALPVEEKTGFPFSSEHPGKMHACGHDSHMAMLLGAARSLKPFEAELPFRLKLMFQPSEECAVSGAKMMVDNGVLEDVDYALCVHVTNDFLTGTAAYARGAVCSACTPMEIRFHGKTSHATIPQMGSDAIAMMFKTYDGIQQILTRRIDPFEPVVCSVGVAHGGEAHNVVCDESLMRVSLRTYKQEVNDFIVDQVKMLSEHASAEMGGTVDFEAHMSAPAVINDGFLADCFIEAGSKILGSANTVERSRLMGSDDFAWFTQARPSLYYWLGVGSPDQKKTALHNNDFTLNEDAMLVGEDLLIGLLHTIAEKAGQKN